MKATLSAAAIAKGFLDFAEHAHLGALDFEPPDLLRRGQ
jgi:hypothetical protein